MTNHFLGELEVKILDRTFILRPTFEAIVELEGRSGKTLSRLLTDYMDPNKQIGITEITAVVFAGIRGAADKNEKAPAYADLGFMIMRHGYVQLYGPVGKFLSAAFSGKPIAELKTDDSKKKDPEPTNELEQKT